MILDGIIGLFGALIEGMAALVVNLLAALAEGVIGLFVSGFTLGRMARKIRNLLNRSNGLRRRFGSACSECFW